MKIDVLSRARLSLGLCLIVAATLAVTAGGRDYTLSDRTTSHRTVRFGSGDRRLEVRLVLGSIRVNGARSQDASMEITRTVRANTAADLERGRQEVDLDISDGAPTVKAIVEGPDPACGTRGNHSGWQRRRYDVTFDLVVSVPAGTELVLCTITGGDVVLDGTEGNFDLNHVNGGIRLTNVKGSGSARTVNGNIRAALVDSPRVDGVFKTVNGDIAVTWPSNVNAGLRMKTRNGGLFTDFEVLSDRPAPSIGRRDADGLFLLKANQYTAVRVGSGGPTITLETLNGDVRVLRGR